MPASSRASTPSPRGFGSSSSSSHSHHSSNNNNNNKIVPTTTTRSAPPPIAREVARPVANLGNTCYMNAVLQALAHSPELCMAMDVKPHSATCPIFLENAQKRRSSPSSSPDYNNNNNNGSSDPQQAQQAQAQAQHVASSKPAATRKSRRSSGKKSPTSSSQAQQESSTAATTATTAATTGEANKNEYKFCAACEVEQHLARVHSVTNNRDKPVAPSTFVSGFIDQVAPWFKLGVQEDSHEFLRLLIDAMQKSCKVARLTTSTSTTTTSTTTQENPQDTPPERDPEEDNEDKPAATDSEYPFQLFRGTVESNVTCEHCKTSSSTLDPIEDIGLEVTTPSSSASSSPPPSSNNSNMSNSSTKQLVDVTSALQRFAKAEALDAGYKCEKCGKVGRATKQSRLASIPPILTLHLKRFRYGEAKAATTVTLPNGQVSRSRRSGRSSEVSQLMASAANINVFAGESQQFYTGKSGSAKIEGHAKFEQVFDLKPYLTNELQAKHSSMFCRLFSVIVHAGKNSHSGHYIAYVRNVSKNEWWKMDDARVTLATVQEVMNAEAYMLFYRVVEHPFAVQLRTQAKKLQETFDEEQQVAVQAVAVQAVAVQAVAVQVVVDDETGTTQAEAAIAAAQELLKVQEEEEATYAATTSLVVAAYEKSKLAAASRKRKAPDFSCGEEWARAKTNNPDLLVGRMNDIEHIISEICHFKPEYYKIIKDEASKENVQAGQGPSAGVCPGTLLYVVLVFSFLRWMRNTCIIVPAIHCLTLLLLFLMTDDDVVDGTQTMKRALIEFFYEIARRSMQDNTSLLTAAKNQLPNAAATAAVAANFDKEALGMIASMMVDADADNFL
jgi:ubiquitin C-terminal hydrolase